MILLQAFYCSITQNSFNLYQSESFSKYSFAKDISSLLFKYKKSNIFQKNPFVFEYSSLIEKFLSGIEIESISFELRDFLSKCLEVK